MALGVAVLALIPTIFLSLVVFLSFTVNEKWKTAKKLPPGNLCLPLIGETLSFFKPHPPTVLGEFMESRLSKFGKVFLSNLIGNWTVVSADAELNQFVLKNDLRLFSPGWPPAMYRLLGRESIPFTVGQEHKMLRSVVVDFLNNERIQTIFLRDVEHLASLLIDSWDESSVISARDEAAKFTLYIMAKHAFGMRHDDPQTKMLQVEYDAFRTGLISFPLSLPGTAFRKALKSRENIVKIIKQEIEKRMEKNDDGRTDEIDFIGLLMKKTDYSPEKIATMVLGIIFAGQETTSKTLASLIYCLEGCPKAVQQLREEHLQAIRSKKSRGESCKLAYEDYKAMEFTKCVINETLRVSNISNFLLKKATKDIEFKGHVIPQGYNVLVHFSSVNLDPSLYENPSNFDPWRWQCSSGVKIMNEFTPFGGGVRLCPGIDLTSLELAVFLHHLVLKYDWQLAEFDQPIKYPFTDFPKGLPIKVRAVSTQV